MRAVHPSVFGAFGIDVNEIVKSLSPYAEIVLWLIVFAETGLLVGFFLPGDSLLFTAGVLAGGGKLDIILLVAGCFVAAVAGDQTGYTIGKRLGPRLFSKQESRIFKQEYVERTKGFFEKHGPKTIVISRFVPIVRTFAPTLAGVGEMPRRTFLRFNVIGALIWAVGITMLGYALGEELGLDKDENIDKLLLPMVVGIVLVSFIPVALEWRKARRIKAAPLAPAAAEAEAEELSEIFDED
jgi:membrane-associated protein